MVCAYNPKHLNSGVGDQHVKDPFSKKKKKNERKRKERRRRKEERKGNKRLDVVAHAKVFKDGSQPGLYGETLPNEKRRRRRRKR
jgi:hypothetical protein